MPHRSQIPVLASPFAKDEGPWQEGVEEGVEEEEDVGTRRGKLDCQ